MTSEPTLAGADIGHSGPVVQLQGIKKSFGLVEVLQAAEVNFGPAVS